jgi:GNAT superfamily N-acetyltransferase
VRTLSTPRAPGAVAREGLRIRDAQESDRGAIEAVTLAAYQQYAATMPTHWEAYRQNILATLAAVVPAMQVVAEQERGVVGTVILYPAGTVFAIPGSPSITRTLPEVRLLAVAPEARGRGIGEALMHECIRRARVARATALTLHTTDIMRAAMRLYERMGFRRAPELDLRPVPDVTIKGYTLGLEPTNHS